MVQDEVFSFIERCERHQRTDELLAELQRQASRFGFDHLIMSGSQGAGRDARLEVELNGWPREWLEQYAARNYARSDAVCLHAFRTITPFFWHEVPLSLARDKRSMRIHAEAAEFGLRSGYVVPMASYRSWSAVISFASGEREIRLGPRDRSVINLMATCAGATAQSLHGYDLPPDLLSPREKEILTWAAAGKTAWEISMILSISRSTVLTHCERIRAKFGVPTMVQAVVEGLRHRIIAP